MKRSFVLAAGLLLMASRAFAGPGEVKAVSVLPAPGRAEVVIDVAGSVGYQDFTLAGPARLVVDITGATLTATRAVYDGVNRGGILDVRYSQFRDDVVRVVIELDALHDYTIVRAEGAVRISVGSDQTFAAWTSLEPRALAAAAATGTTASPYAAEVPATLASVAQSQQPRITVTYDSATVADVMAGLAAFSGRSIVLGKSVQGTVTAEIKNQPWDVAFQAILSSQGLSAIEEESGIIRVDNPAILAQRDSLEPLTTKLVRVNYARASALLPAIGAVLSARGKVVADTSSNTLIITDVESRVDRDSVFVTRLDVRTPQIAIQAKLIFVDRTDIENLGVQYDLGTSGQFFNKLIQRPDPATAEGVDIDGVPDITKYELYDKNSTVVNLGGNALSGIANADAIIPSPALNLIFSTALGGYSLTTFIEALQRVELADLQAEPVITTADNTQAHILVGEKTPIRVIDVSSPQGGTNNVPRATTNIVETGIILRVTPHVTSSRQILNQILVNDGETAVIGGLTVTQLTVSKTGIPFLVDLPIIGGLFGFTQRQEERRDLLILVTPHVIDFENPVAAAAGGR
jgi:type IV pilus assembly protein PilQ